jgi:hypothetical protein
LAAADAGAATEAGAALLGAAAPPPHAASTPASMRLPSRVCGVFIYVLLLLLVVAQSYW